MPIVYVLRDTMPQNSNIGRGKLDELTSTLGMNKTDVDNLLANSTTSNEQTYLSAGPMYCSNYYGTISIKDF